MPELLFDSSPSPRSAAGAASLSPWVRIPSTHSLHQLRFVCIPLHLLFEAWNHRLSKMTCLDLLGFTEDSWGLGFAGAYKYIEELWRKKQSDVLRFLLRVRCWEFRQLPGIVRVTRPSRPDKARRLGYKAKQVSFQLNFSYSLDPFSYVCVCLVDEFDSVWIPELDFRAKYHRTTISCHLYALIVVSIWSQL